MSTTGRGCPGVEVSDARLAAIDARGTCRIGTPVGLVGNVELNLVAVGRRTALLQESQPAGIRLPAAFGHVEHAVGAARVAANPDAVGVRPEAHVPEDGKVLRLQAVRKVVALGGSVVLVVGAGVGVGLQQVSPGVDEHHARCILGHQRVHLRAEVTVAAEQQHRVRLEPDGVYVGQQHALVGLEAVVIAHPQRVLRCAKCKMGNDK